MRIFRRHGLARLGRRSAIIVILNVALVVGIGAHVAGGNATGVSPSAIADADPLRLIGLKPGDVSCPKAPMAIGRDTMMVCPRWTAVLSASGVVEVVSVYGPDNPVVDAYEGALPGGLHWGDPIGAAWKALGRPNRITSAYGTPTLVYFYHGKAYGSLELRFDSREHLIRVNASTVH